MTSPTPAGRPRKKRRAVSISRIMALTFLGIIVFGALLLNLPGTAETEKIRAAPPDRRPARRGKEQSEKSRKGPASFAPFVTDLEADLFYATSFQRRQKRYPRTKRCLAVT